MSGFIIFLGGLLFSMRLQQAWRSVTQAMTFFPPYVQKWETSDIQNQSAVRYLWL